MIWLVTAHVYRLLYSRHSIEEVMALWVVDAYGWCRGFWDGLVGEVCILGLLSSLWWSRMWVPSGVAGYSFSSLSVFPYGFSFKEVLMRPGVHHSSLTLSCNPSLGCCWLFCISFAIWIWHSWGNIPSDECFALVYWFSHFVGHIYTNLPFTPKKNITIIIHQRDNSISCFPAVDSSMK